MPISIKQLKDVGTGTPFVPVTHWDAISNKPLFSQDLVTVADTVLSQELAPNVVYYFASRTNDLTLTLGTPVANKVNEYHFFVEVNSVPTITWPSGITWAYGLAPTLVVNNIYEVSILNDVAIYISATTLTS